MKLNDVYWVAGLIEGEGSFDYNRGTVRIQVAMTDRDIIDRLRTIVNFGSVREVKRYQAHHKPCFAWSGSGRQAAALMMTIYSLMGQRRKDKIYSILSVWKKTAARRPSWTLSSKTYWKNLGREHKPKVRSEA